MNFEWKYVKPTTLEKIVEVEKGYGVVLPTDFKELILRYNNGRPVNSGFNSDKTNDLDFGQLLSYNKEDADNIYTYADVFKENTPSLFPVTLEPGGDFVCLKENKIVHWCHETGKDEFVADSITELINSLYE